MGSVFGSQADSASVCRPHRSHGHVEGHDNQTEGPDWLTVITLVDDPKYLSQQFITSSHFKTRGRWVEVVANPMYVNHVRSVQLQPDRRSSQHLSAGLADS